MFTLMCKENVLRYQGGRDVVPGFLTYTDRQKPVLMHCYGWQDYSDAYDDYMITTSVDNGHTWSEPYVHWQSSENEEGKLRYGEPAAFFDRDKETLLTLTNQTMYPNDTLDVDRSSSVVLQSYYAWTNSWSERTQLDVPASMSFCFPIKTSAGRIIFPAQRWYTDENGKPVHYKGCWCPAGVIVHIMGDYRKDGSIEWKTSQPLIPDLEKTSRGFYEPTLVERKDGSLVMILRGDNSMFEDRPGYKWVSFSNDGGDTWSEAEPLSFCNGKMLQSGSNGSALFRSKKNGELYWIGNLCIYGEQPKGNAPRTSLVIGRVNEDPFAIDRQSLFVIDEKGYNDSLGLQLSNFRYYEDRYTHDIVVYMTRLGEKDPKQWQIADYYRYRIAIS